jgi:hypothetical protein
MTIFKSLSRQTFTVPCTVEIEHSADSLHAHVELEGDFGIRPGDEVLVHNAPTDIPFGGKILVRRTATIVRAGLLERAWTRFTGNFELTELYEVSFSERRKL